MAHLCAGQYKLPKINERWVPFPLTADICSKQCLLSWVGFNIPLSCLQLLCMPSLLFQAVDSRDINTILWTALP